MKVFTGIVFVIMVFLFSPASAEDIYTIPDIKIEASAKNATLARSEALTIGQKKAFEELMTKILPEGTKIPEASYRNIRNLIKSRQIKNEKISRSSYSGIATFVFSEPRVNKFLINQGINLTEKSLGSLLVLPLLRTKEGLYLWEEDNPWKQSWQNAATGNKSIIIPKGDIEDVIIASTEDISQSNLESIKNLATKYQTSNILIPEASYYLEKSSNTPYLRVDMKYFDGMGFKTETKNFKAVGDKGFEWLIQNASQNLVKEVNNEWKNTTITIDTANLDIIVPLRNPKEWADIRKRLASLSNVLTSVKLIAFTYGQADINVIYRDAPEFLEQNFSNAGLKISYENGYWILTKN